MRDKQFLPLEELFGDERTEVVKKVKEKKTDLAMALLSSEVVDVEETVDTVIVTMRNGTVITLKGEPDDFHADKPGFLSYNITH